MKFTGEKQREESVQQSQLTLHGVGPTYNSQTQTHFAGEHSIHILKAI